MSKFIKICPRDQTRASQIRFNSYEKKLYVKQMASILQYVGRDFYTIPLQGQFRKEKKSNFVLKRMALIDKKT